MNEKNLEITIESTEMPLETDEKLTANPNVEEINTEGFQPLPIGDVKELVRNGSKLEITLSDGSIGILSCTKKGEDNLYLLDGNDFGGIKNLNQFALSKSEFNNGSGKVESFNCRIVTDELKPESKIEKPNNKINFSDLRKRLSREKMVYIRGANEDILKLSYHPEKQNEVYAINGQFYSRKDFDITFADQAMVIDDCYYEIVNQKEIAEQDRMINIIKEEMNTKLDAAEAQNGNNDPQQSDDNSTDIDVNQKIVKTDPDDIEAPVSQELPDDEGKILKDILDNKEYLIGKRISDPVTLDILRIIDIRQNNKFVVFEFADMDGNQKERMLTPFDASKFLTGIKILSDSKPEDTDQTSVKKVPEEKTQLGKEEITEKLWDQQFNIYLIRALVSAKQNQLSLGNDELNPNKKYRDQLTQRDIEYFSGFNKGLTKLLETKSFDISSGEGEKFDDHGNIHRTGCLNTGVKLRLGWIKIGEKQGKPDILIFKYNPIPEKSTDTQPEPGGNAALPVVEPMKPVKPVEKTQDNLATESIEQISEKKLKLDEALTRIAKAKKLEEGSNTKTDEPQAPLVTNEQIEKMVADRVEKIHESIIEKLKIEQDAEKERNRQNRQDYDAKAQELIKQLMAEKDQIKKTAESQIQFHKEHLEKACEQFRQKRIEFEKQKDEMQKINLDESQKLQADFKLQIEQIRQMSKDEARQFIASQKPAAPQPTYYQPEIKTEAFQDLQEVIQSFQNLEEVVGR